MVVGGVTVFFFIDSHIECSSVFVKCLFFTFGRVILLRDLLQLKFVLLLTPSMSYQVNS